MRCKLKLQGIVGVYIYIYIENVLTNCMKIFTHKT